MNKLYSFIILLHVIPCAVLAMDSNRFITSDADLYIINSQHSNPNLSQMNFDFINARNDLDNPVTRHHALTTIETLCFQHQHAPSQHLIAQFLHENKYNLRAKTPEPETLARNLIKNASLQNYKPAQYHEALLLLQESQTPMDLSHNMTFKYQPPQYLKHFAENFLKTTPAQNLYPQLLPAPPSKPRWPTKYLKPRKQKTYFKKKPRNTKTQQTADKQPLQQIEQEFAPQEILKVAPEKAVAQPVKKSKINPLDSFIAQCQALIKEDKSNNFIELFIKKINGLIKQDTLFDELSKINQQLIPELDKLKQENLSAYTALGLYCQTIGQTVTKKIKKRLKDSEKTLIDKNTNWLDQAASYYQKSGSSKDLLTIAELKAENKIQSDSKVAQLLKQSIEAANDSSIDRQLNLLKEKALRADFQSLTVLLELQTQDKIKDQALNLIEKILEELASGIDYKKLESFINSDSYMAFTNLLNQLNDPKMTYAFARCIGQTYIKSQEKDETVIQKAIELLDNCENANDEAQWYKIHVLLNYNSKQALALLEEKAQINTDLENPYRTKIETKLKELAQPNSNGRAAYILSKFLENTQDAARYYEQAIAAKWPIACFEKAEKELAEKNISQALILLNHCLDSSAQNIAQKALNVLKDINTELISLDELYTGVKKCLPLDEEFALTWLETAEEKQKANSFAQGKKIRISGAYEILKNQQTNQKIATHLALAHFDRAINAKNNRGYILKNKLSELEAALEYLNKCDDISNLINPNNLYLALSAEHQNHNNIEQAETCLKAISEHSTEAQFKLAELYKQYPDIFKNEEQQNQIKLLFQKVANSDNKDLSTKAQARLKELEHSKQQKGIALLFNNVVSKIQENEDTISSLNDNQKVIFAKKAFEEQKYAEALKLFESLPADYPKEKYLLKKAECLKKLKRPQEALQAINILITYALESLEMLKALGHHDFLRAFDVGFHLIDNADESAKEAEYNYAAQLIKAIELLQHDPAIANYIAKAIAILKSAEYAIEKQDQDTKDSRESIAELFTKFEELCKKHKSYNSLVILAEIHAERFSCTLYFLPSSYAHLKKAHTLLNCACPTKDDNLKEKMSDLYVTLYEHYYEFKNGDQDKLAGQCILKALELNQKNGKAYYELSEFLGKSDIKLDTSRLNVQTSDEAMCLALHFDYPPGLYDKAIDLYDSPGCEQGGNLLMERAISKGYRRAIHYMIDRSIKNNDLDNAQKFMGILQAQHKSCKRKLFQEQLLTFLISQGKPAYENNIQGQILMEMLQNEASMGKYSAELQLHKAAFYLNQSDLPKALLELAKNEYRHNESLTLVLKGLKIIETLEVIEQSNDKLGNRIPVLIIQLGLLKQHLLKENEYELQDKKFAEVRNLYIKLLTTNFKLTGFIRLMNLHLGAVQFGSDTSGALKALELWTGQVIKEVPLKKCESSLNNVTEILTKKKQTTPDFIQQIDEMLDMIEEKVNKNKV